MIILRKIPFFFLGVIFLVLSCRSFFDPNIFYNDAPRILMDGVFISDFFTMHGFMNPVQFIFKYYAQYPAIDLGYKPPFFPFIESFFISMFGIKIWAARLSLIFFGFLGMFFLYRLVEKAYNRSVAFLVVLLTFTAPFIIQWSWYTMLELPTLSLIIGTTYFAYLYGEERRPIHCYLFATFFVLSIWTKQTAIFALLAFLPYFCIKLRLKGFLKKEILLVSFLSFLFLLPLVYITLKLGKVNIGQSIGTDSINNNLAKFSPAYFLYYIKSLYQDQLFLGLVLLSFFGLVLDFIEEKRGSLFFLVVLAAYIFFTYMNVKEPRYIILWIPFIIIFTCIPVYYLRSVYLRFFYAGVLCCCAAFNIYQSFYLQMNFVSGFDEAARIATEQSQTKSILIDAYNNGYFTFYVRANDPTQKFFVYRGDKLLTSSAIFADKLSSEHAFSREDIQNILNVNDVDILVLESKNYTPYKIHDELRSYVKTDDFMLLKSIPIKSNLKRYEGEQTVDIYRFNKRTPTQSLYKEISVPTVGKKLIIPQDGSPAYLKDLD